MERENIQTRVRSSIAALKKEGRYAGGNVPYGYQPAKDPDGPGRILVPKAAEVAIVQEVARRVIAGEKLYKLALDLSDRGVATRKGKGTRWSVQALRQILLQDAIVGRVTHHGELIRDAEGMPLQVWAPVLDLETWHRVRAVLEADKPAGKGQRGLAAPGWCLAS